MCQSSLKIEKWLNVALNLKLTDPVTAWNTFVFVCTYRWASEWTSCLPPSGLAVPLSGTVWTGWALLPEDFEPLSSSYGVWWGNSVLFEGVPNTWRHLILWSEGKELDDRHRIFIFYVELLVSSNTHQKQKHKCNPYSENNLPIQCKVTE